MSNRKEKTDSLKDSRHPLFVAPRALRVAHHGFALLELLVVICIVSLMASIVFPSLYPLEEREMKSEARRISSMLRYLNDGAIMTKQTHTMRLDLRERFISSKGPGFEKSERFRYLKGVELQSKGEITDGQVTVLFGPLGVQENMAVRLGNGKNTMRVELNAMSGRVKIVTSNR